MTVTSVFPQEFAEQHVQPISGRGHIGSLALSKFPFDNLP
jgi:hypothetical protein